ncbi:hypothetical protein FJY93_05205, partial [Candidatus Kaiserbacteria bacterium]|nr:hypothetical protein [Candidatus Kaiserbacteria bacterium]
EIRAFVPEQYWVVTADLSTKGGSASGGKSVKKSEQFTATCVEEPKSQADADAIVKRALAGSWIVKGVEESEASRAPRAPFSTSTLQQVASTRLGFSPSRTMRIAQKLYEAGYITYMRTDSTNLAKDAQAAILARVRIEYGENYAQPRVFKTKAKGAQEAHEAIRPTDPTKRNLGHNEEQKKLYALIRARALASQMADAKLARTKLMTTIESGDIPDFTATGSRVLFDGWLKADTAARGEDVELPRVMVNEPLTLVAAESEGKETQPPARYSEAGLVKELEKRGIGRPSTYASIIKTIDDRGYVEKQGRTLIPTPTGDVVSTFIENNFGEYISDTFTAEMENELDEIAEGKRTYEKTLADFYKPFVKAIKSKAKIEKITNMGDAPQEFPCPLCDGPMVYKLSKTGRFMSCARFPDCLGARKEDGSIIEAPKDIGEACPQCKDGKLHIREGRFGTFIACSNYPKCKFVKKDPEEEARAKTGVACPICVAEGRKNGEMVERRGRFGPFFSCSNYPDCKLAIKARPTGNICTLCGSLMMLGTKTIPERCSSKTCPMHNPHKMDKASKGDAF